MRNGERNVLEVVDPRPANPDKILHDVPGSYHDRKNFPAAQKRIAIHAQAPRVFTAEAQRRGELEKRSCFLCALCHLCVLKALLFLGFLCVSAPLR
jgi:hypothetical protein